MSFVPAAGCPEVGGLRILPERLLQAALHGVHLHPLVPAPPSVFSPTASTPTKWTCGALAACSTRLLGRAEARLVSETSCPVPAGLRADVPKRAGWQGSAYPPGGFEPGPSFTRQTAPSSCRRGYCTGQKTHSAFIFLLVTYLSLFARD